MGAAPVGEKYGGVVSGDFGRIDDDRDLAVLTDGVVVPVDTPEYYGCVVNDNTFGVDFFECWLGGGDSDGEREVVGVGVGG